MFVDFIQRERAFEVVAESLPPSGGVAQVRQLADLRRHLSAHELARFPGGLHLGRIVAGLEGVIQLIVRERTAADLAAKVVVLAAHLGFEAGDLLDARLVLLVLGGRQVDQAQLSGEQWIARRLHGQQVFRRLVDLRIGPVAHVRALRLLLAEIGLVGPGRCSFPLGKVDRLV